MSQFRKKYKVISNLKAAKLLLRRAAPGFFGRRTLSHSCLIYEPSFSTLLVVFCFVMFSIGERSPESSTIKPYCSNSYRMQFTVACWKMQALPWKRCFREALMHSCASCQFHRHQCTSIPSALQAFEQIPPRLFSLEVVASMYSKKNFKFRFIWRQSSFTHWQRWL